MISTKVMIQLKKIMHEEMDARGLSLEEKIDFCYDMQESCPDKLIKVVSNRIFCDLIDIQKKMVHVN